jgi:hypothetical protein
MTGSEQTMRSAAIFVAGLFCGMVLIGLVLEIAR